MRGWRDVRGRAPKRLKTSLFVLRKHLSQDQTGGPEDSAGGVTAVKIKLTSVYVDGGHLGQ